MLEARIKGIPDKENLLLLGDFNTHVDADHSDSSWLHCIRHFSVDKLSDNGQ